MIHTGAEICFKSGGWSVCTEGLKSTQAARESFTAWGPGARIRAPVGSRDKAPGGGPGGEEPGSSRIYCLNLFYFNTFFLKKSPIGKIVAWATLTYHSAHILRGGGLGAEPSGAPGPRLRVSLVGSRDNAYGNSRVQDFQSKILSKFFYFNT